MLSQGIPLKTNAFYVLSVSLKVSSVGTNKWTRHSTWNDLNLMFDTGAATHVCPWRLGKQFPTYESKGHSGIVGAERIQNPVHGIRTIFLKMRPDKDVAVGSTFAGVLFKNLSSLSVRCPTQMLWMFTDL